MESVLLAVIVITLIVVLIENMIIFCNIGKYEKLLQANDDRNEMLRQANEYLAREIDNIYSILAKGTQ